MVGLDRQEWGKYKIKVISPFVESLRKCNYPFTDCLESYNDKILDNGKVSTVTEKFWGPVWIY